MSRRPGMAESDLRGNDYEDVAGFCYSASLDDLKKHDFVLTPGRYVGAEEQEDDGEPFAEKMDAPNQHFKRTVCRIKPTRSRD